VAVVDRAAGVDEFADEEVSIVGSRAPVGARRWVWPGRARAGVLSGVCRSEDDVSELIAATDLRVHPDYHMFGFGDQPAGFGGHAPTPAPGWLGVGASSVLIGVGEDLVCPVLRLEHWDREPPSGPPGHEAQETIRLLLPTGRLGLNQISAGGIPDILTVPPGVYAVRITCWNRERTRREFATLLQSGLDWEDPEFKAARAGLEDRERYLVQLWLQSPTSNLIDSIGVLIHDGYDRFGIADSSARTGLVSPAGSEWLTVGASSAMVRIARRHGRPGLRMELWNGPPPEPEQGRTLQQMMRIHLSSGSLDLVQVKSGQTGVREILGGMIPRILTVPPGDYHLRIAGRVPAPGEDGQQERYLAQFWPA
jgi:hypothetical protein